jgi:membrane protein implicated in regulation of membrane protease activity
MTASRRAERGGGGGLYLAITVIALIVAVWLAVQVIGFLLRLILLVIAALIALAAYRAWRARE